MSNFVADFLKVSVTAAKAALGTKTNRADPIFYRIAQSVQLSGIFYRRQYCKQGSKQADSHLANTVVIASIGQRRKEKCLHRMFFAKW
jgi:hypothetical protein